MCDHKGSTCQNGPSAGSATVLPPPLDSLRFFEAAARRQSFARAASELGVSAGAVAHRIRTLEKHLDVELFDRRQRSVRLNRRGQTYLKEVQRILADVHGVSQRHRREPERVRVVSVEAVAEKWLVPRLANCCPALLAARGRPGCPADLHGWPLLYDLGWDADWAYWFARQGESAPDLSQASGFRLYSMLVSAAVNGVGAAIGRPMLIARELERRALVPMFDRQSEAPNAAAFSRRRRPANGPRSRRCGNGSSGKPVPQSARL